jgi:hypothetical protein
LPAMVSSLTCTIVLRTLHAVGREIAA